MNPQAFDRLFRIHGRLRYGPFPPQRGQSDAVDNTSFISESESTYKSRMIHLLDQGFVRGHQIPCYRPILLCHSIGLAN